MISRVWRSRNRWPIWVYVDLSNRIRYLYCVVKISNWHVAAVVRCFFLYELKQCRLHKSLVTQLKRCSLLCMTYVSREWINDCRVYGTGKSNKWMCSLRHNGRYIRYAYGPGSGPISFDRMSCDGSYDTDFTQCSPSTYDSYSRCDHADDVSISCGTEFTRGR